MRCARLVFLFLVSTLVGACSGGGNGGGDMPQLLPLPSGHHSGGGGSGTSTVLMSGIVSQKNDAGTYTAPVAGAAVHIEPGGHVVTADSKGAWQIELHPGSYTVSAMDGALLLDPPQIIEVITTLPVVNVNFVERIIPSMDPFVYIKKVSNSITNLTKVNPISAESSVVYQDPNKYPMTFTPVRGTLDEFVFTVALGGTARDKDGGVWLVDAQSGKVTYPVPAQRMVVFTGKELYPSIPVGEVSAVRDSKGALYVAISSPCDLDYCKDETGTHKNRNAIIVFKGDGSLAYIRVTPEGEGINTSPLLGRVDLKAGTVQVFWTHLADQNAVTGTLWMQTINLETTPDLVGPPIKIADGVASLQRSVSLGLDGTHVVFVRLLAGEGSIPALSAESRLLVKSLEDLTAPEVDLGSGWAPYWAPEDRIWFSDQGHNFSMFPDGTNRHEITAPKDDASTGAYIMPILW